MKVRIVDFIANRGGGLRFAVELVGALLRGHPDVTFELVSDRRGVAAYRARIGEGHDNLRSCIVPSPRAHFRPLLGLLRLPGARRLAGTLDLGRLWHVDVPSAFLEGCDAVWFPWLHRHRIAWHRSGRVVASFHDATFLLFGGLARRHPHSMFVESEREITRRWLDSNARIVCSSRATVNELSRIFPIAPSRLEMVRVGGDHFVATGGGDEPPPWPWLDRPYLLCPANTALHKNHETLFRAVGSWGAKWPLVLTGEGSDLDVRWRRRALSLIAALGLVRPPRSTVLRQLAESVGLEVGRTLHPLGFVSEPLYRVLLRCAAALVMPTLAEGGGSFPVFEAARLGIPALCSDLPVLREQVEHEGTPVLFFDPHRPETLAAVLAELESNYASVRNRAMAHASGWHGRRWDDVAGEYWQLIESVAHNE